MNIAKSLGALSLLLSATVPSAHALAEELTERLREELDYGREARHIALYRIALADEPLVRVPEPVPGASQPSSAQIQEITNRAGGT